MLIHFGELNWIPEPEKQAVCLVKTRLFTSHSDESIVIGLGNKSYKAGLIESCQNISCSAVKNVYLVKLSVEAHSTGLYDREGKQ